MPRDDDFFVDPDKIDCGPWYMVPQRGRSDPPGRGSTRVARFRYDYGNQVVQVRWSNEAKPYSNNGYLYDGGYEEFRRLIRITSKGKHINDPMNGFTYRPMNPGEYDAPVTRKTAPLSKSKNVSEIMD